LARFGSQEQDVAVAVLEEVLAAMVENELRRFDVGFEVELLGNESQWHVLFVTKAELADSMRGGEEK
jgi:hypothetical protein